MNDDSKLTTLFREVAADVPERDDDEALARLRRAASGDPGSGASAVVRRGGLLLAAAAVVAVVGIGASLLIAEDQPAVVDTGDDPVDLAAGLSGRSFRFVSGDDVLAASPETPTLAFDELLRASGGCNTAMAEWSVVDGRLVAERFLTTEILCAGPAGDADRALVALLEAGPEVDLTGDRLVLRTGDRVVVFEAAGELPPDPDETPTSEPSATTAPPSTSTPATVPPVAGEPAMVVVDEGGSRVTVYWPDGREPLRYSPPDPVAHASLGAGGATLWLTVGGPGSATPPALREVEPSSGRVIEEIPGAGYAAVSPDGSRLAYSIVGSYGGTEQAVVIRDLAGGRERTIPAQRPAGSEAPSIVGAFAELAWAPDGRRLIVDEEWEDDAFWIIDVDTVEFVVDGQAFSQEGADWLSPTRLLATAYCCYAEPSTEPRHLVEIDLSGPEPVVVDRRELASPVVAAVAGEGLATAVYVDEDGVLRRLADGTEIARNVVSVSW